MSADNGEGAVPDQSGHKEFFYGLSPKKCGQRGWVGTKKTLMSADIVYGSALMNTTFSETTVVFLVVYNIATLQGGAHIIQC